MVTLGEKMQLCGLLMVCGWPGCVLAAAYSPHVAACDMQAGRHAGVCRRGMPWWLYQWPCVAWRQSPKCKPGISGRGISATWYAEKRGMHVYCAVGTVDSIDLSVPPLFLFALLRALALTAPHPFCLGLVSLGEGILNLVYVPALPKTKKTPVWWHVVAFGCISCCEKH